MEHSAAHSAAVDDTGQSGINVKNDAASILDDGEQCATEEVIVIPSDPEPDDEHVAPSTRELAPSLSDDNDAQIEEDHATDDCVPVMPLDETILDVKTCSDFEVLSTDHSKSIEKVSDELASNIPTQEGLTTAADESNKVRNSDEGSKIETVQLIVPNSTCENDSSVSSTIEQWAAKKMSIQDHNSLDIHVANIKKNYNISMTSTYHPATQNKSASQLLKNGELQKRKLEGTITTTKIIDVALPVAHSGGNYLIDTQLGTISHHANDDVSPPKLMKLSNKVNVEESGIRDDLNNYCHPLTNFQQSNNTYMPHSKEESISAANNLAALNTSSSDDIGRLPSLSSFTFPMKYTSQKSTASDADGTMGVDSMEEVKILDQLQSSQYSGGCCNKVKVQSTYNIGTEIYEAARMSGICDSDDSMHDMLYNTTLESTQDVKDPHTEYYQPANGSRKSYYAPASDEMLPKTEKFTESDVFVHNSFGNRQMMNSGNNHPKAHEQWKASNLVYGQSGSQSDADLSTNCLRNGDVHKMNSKENVQSGSGVQVLSTWKVAVNKTSQNRNTLTPKNLLTNLTNIGKKSTGLVLDRTPHTSLGKYLVQSLNKDKNDGQALNRLPVQLLSSTSSSSGFRSVSPYLSAPMISKQESFSSLNYHTPFSSSVSLNSSGSDEGPSPPDYLMRNYSCCTPYNTPTEGLASPAHILPTAGQLNAALYRAREATCLSDSELDVGRQAHNAKERARRARIKLACEHLRDLVPGMTMKTDKATVFEFAVQYIAFLRQYVGMQYDKDFLRNCNPY